MSSLIFSQQGDKSELRGATPNFLSQLALIPVQDWLPASLLSIQIEPNLFPGWESHSATIPATFVIHRFLCFKAKHIVGLPLSYRLPYRYPLGLFLHRRRLLLCPKVPYLLVRPALRYKHFVDSFYLLHKYHYLWKGFTNKYPCKQLLLFLIPRGTGVLCSSSSL